MWQIVVSGLLTGAGIGLALASTSNAIIESVPALQTSEVISVNTIARTIGSSIGTAVIAAIITSNSSDMGLPLDDAFTDLVPVDGRVEHIIAAPDGSTVTVWADEVFAWVQAFTSTTLRPGRIALAVEPMTMPADAFNSGHGLTWLPPGETLAARWGIAAHIEGERA